MDQQQDVVQKRIDEKQKREKKQEKLKKHKDTLADLQKAAVSHELAQEIGLGEEEKRRVDRRLSEEEEERHRQQRKEDELRDQVKQKRFKEAREQVINEGKRENEMQARVFSDKLEELKHLNKIEADKRMQFVMQIDSNRQLAELEQVLAKTAAIHKSKIAAEQRFMERAKDDMNSAVEKEREQVKRLEEQEALLQQKIGAMLGQFRRAVDLAEQGTLTAEGGQGENDIRELINKLNGQVREALGTDDVGKEEEEEEEDDDDEDEEEEEEDNDDDDDDSRDDDDSIDDEEDRKKDRSGWIRDIEKDKDQDMNGQILDDFGNKNEKRIRGYIPEDDEIKNKEQEQQQQKDQEQKDILIQSNLSPTINQPQQTQPSYQSSLLSPPPSSTYNQRMTYPNNSIQRKRPSSSIIEYKQSYSMKSSSTSFPKQSVSQFQKDQLQQLKGVNKGPWGSSGTLSSSINRQPPVWSKYQSKQKSPIFRKTTFGVENDIVFLRNSHDIEDVNISPNRINNPPPDKKTGQGNF